MRDLADGVVLCELAKVIDQAEAEYRETAESKHEDSAAIKLSKKKGNKGKTAVQNAIVRRTSASSLVKSKAPPSGGRKKKKQQWAYVPPDAKSVLRASIRQRPLHTLMPYTQSCIRGSAEARKSVATFLSWAQDLGCIAPDLFEVDSLCRYLNEVDVLHGLLDLARRTRGLRVPLYLVFERSRYRTRISPFPSTLDERIHDISEDMICGLEFEKSSTEGQYRVHAHPPLEKDILMVREVGKNVVVRIGGGWVSLRQWISENDPWIHNSEMQAALAIYRDEQTELLEDLAKGVKANGTHSGIRSGRTSTDILVPVV